jgi:hypothetical protein
MDEYIRNYCRNPITPHRLYSVLYRAIWPTNDPGSLGEAEMARNLAIRYLKDITPVDLPQLQVVLMRVWEGPAKQPGAFQKLRDIYDLAARTNPALPTFLDVAAGVKPQEPRPSSLPPPPKSGSGAPPKSPPKPATTSAPAKAPQPTSQATCRACDGRGYTVKIDKNNVLKEGIKITCSRCGGSGFEPGPSKSKGGGRWRGGGSRQEETEDEKDVNRAADTFLKKYGFGKWGVKMHRYRNPDEEYRQLQREKETGDPHASIKLLIYRIRHGELSLDNLKLAALLGDTDAKEVYRSYIKRKRVGSAKSIGEAITRYYQEHSDPEVARSFLIRYLIDCLEHHLPEWEKMLPGNDLDIFIMGRWQLAEMISILRNANSVEVQNLLAQINDANFFVALSRQIVIPGNDYGGDYSRENLSQSLRHLFEALRILSGIVLRPDYTDEIISPRGPFLSRVMQTKDELIDATGRYAKATKSTAKLPRRLLSKVLDAAQVQGKARERLWQEAHLLEMSLAEPSQHQ